jgi:cystathionine beta-lyase/cystathionine gamma-synthase
MTADGDPIGGAAGVGQQDDDLAITSRLMTETNLFGAAVPPIVQTSLFTFASVAEMEAAFNDPMNRPVYTRGRNPTVQAFEDKLATLEHADEARGFASGMGAISGSLLAFLKSGDKLVAVRHLYPDAYRLMTGLMSRLGIETVFVDGEDLTALEKAAQGAKMVYLESPTTMLFDGHDLPAQIEIARQAGALSIVDNSWASPIFQQPLTLGADLVVHSASKYLSGHSDTVAGVVAGRRDLIEQINTVTMPSLGAKLSPFDGWLLIRGLRTLPLRMARHHATGLEIARRLADHKRVAIVHHPLLNKTDWGSLSGGSGLFSFRVDGDADMARRVCDGLSLFRLGVSWGGHESLAFPAQLGRTQPGLTQPFEVFDVPRDLIRIHAGLEEVEDLWRDLDRALNAA